jgi:hypothetical protein
MTAFGRSGRQGVARHGNARFHSTLYGGEQTFGLDNAFMLGRACRLRGVRSLSTSVEREALIEAQDRLIDLFVQHDEASRTEDSRRVQTLKAAIDDAIRRRDQIRNSSRPGE